MLDIIKIRGIILFVIAFCNLILALFILSKSKGNKVRLWLGLTALSSGLFAFTCGGSYFFWQEYSMASALWWRATWSGVFIIPSLNIFVCYFVGNTRHIIIKGILLYVAALVIGSLALTTNFFVDTLHPRYVDIYSGGVGPVDSLGRIYLLLGLGMALVNIVKKYITSHGEEKTRFRYFVWGTSISLIVGIVTSLVPFLIGKSLYFDIPAFSSFLWIFFVTYSIFKYNIFDMRTFVSELLIFGMSIVLFARIIFSGNYIDLALNIVLTVLLTLIGFLFLKSIYKEVELDKKLLQETQKNLELEKELRKDLTHVSMEAIRKIENNFK